MPASELPQTELTLDQVKRFFFDDIMGDAILDALSYPNCNTDFFKEELIKHIAANLPEDPDTMWTDIEK